MAAGDQGASRPSPHRETAVLHVEAILGIAREVIRTGRTDADLGPTYFDGRDAERVTRRLTRRLEDLGYDVVLRRASGRAAE